MSLHNRKHHIKLFALLVLVLALKPAVSNIYDCYWRIEIKKYQHEIDDLADWITNHTNAEDKILVWGFAPQIYLKSQRFAGSAHMHNLLLTNVNETYLPLDENLLHQFQEDIRLQKPKYIFNLSSIMIEKYSDLIDSQYDKSVLPVTSGNMPYYTLKSNADLKTEAMRSEALPSP